MKTSETCVAQGELQPETLEAPISLNPEQLETIAAGISLSSITKGTIWGLIFKTPINPGGIPSLPGLPFEM